MTGVSCQVCGHHLSEEWFEVHEECGCDFCITCVEDELCDGCLSHLWTELEAEPLITVGCCGVSMPEDMVLICALCGRGTCPDCFWSLSGCCDACASGVLRQVAEHN